MTKEEAKIFLYSIAGDLGFTDVENYTCKDGEKMREAIRALEQQPYEDAISRQVRCKDCKYWRGHKYAKETKRYIPFCGFNAIYTKSDAFCSRAERREE